MAAGVEPFGTYGLSAIRSALRHFAGSRRPAGHGLDRLRYSLFRRMAFYGRPEHPVDIVLFEGVRARLHIADNGPDRLVCYAPDGWDAAERAALAALLQATPADEPFVFVDIGANTGLYSLWMLSCARRYGRVLRVLAIEPDERSRQRLLFNIAASQAEDVITVEHTAVADRCGLAVLLVNAQDRGRSRLVDEALPGQHPVRCEPLAAILARNGLDRPHAMKLDIEGGEIRALAPYLQNVSRESLPRLIIAEWQAESREALVALMRKHDYAIQDQTDMNVIFALDNTRQNGAER